MALGDLAVGLQLDNRQFIGGLNTAKKSLGGFAASVTSGLQLAAGAAVAGGAAFGVLGLKGIQLAAVGEQTEVAFKTMLGSASAAKELLGDLREFAVETPFEEEEINASAKALLAFGTSASDIPDELRMIGDISSGLGIPLKELADLYGKARVQGRLFGEDINQLTGRGIPIITELAKVMKTSEGNVKSLVTAGKIGFPEMQSAFKNMTSEGGQFGGMMEEQSETLLGLWATTKDSLNAVLREIGVAITEEFDLKQTAKDIIAFTEQFKTDWVPKIVEGFKLIGGTIGGIVDDVKEFEKVMDELALRAADKLGLTKDSADEVLLAQREVAAKNAAVKEADAARDTLFNKKLNDQMYGIFDPVRAETEKVLAQTNAMPDGSLKNEDKWKDNGGLIDVSGLDVPSMPDVVKFQKELESQSEGVFEQKLDKMLNAKRDDGAKVGSLEKDSQEAFEVLRANVGNKTEDKQLKETQQTNALLKKVVSNTSKQQPAVAVRGLD